MDTFYLDIKQGFRVEYSAGHVFCKTGKYTLVDVFDGTPAFHEYSILRERFELSELAQILYPVVTDTDIDE